METKKHTMKTYVIEMTEEEAIYLRGVMQNPMYGMDPHEEAESHRIIRRAFFDAVEDAGRIKLPLEVKLPLGVK